MERGSRIKRAMGGQISIIITTKGNKSVTNLNNRPSLNDVCSRHIHVLVRNVQANINIYYNRCDIKLKHAVHDDSVLLLHNRNS